ncbi:hypothetical protein [Paenibacillus sp. GP183]|uniref:hypothetical protein n=1 Tax=Paenibacillus sp. GP183 TaxID=1882751 RepID=UPI00089A9BA4|nr:hypothetical protein [Paenibacillus sp. GP183]SEC15616.1 hypothetical protein SAMN05443246_3174 [Paenibacillus sp. GP183]
MKKKTVWISAAIAVVVAIPGVSAWAASVSPSPAPTSIVAATTAPAADSTEAADTHEGKGKGKGGHDKGGSDKGRGGEGFMGGGIEKGGVKGSVHSQEYLTLLAEKYAPDQAAAIKAAYDEKASISKQIQDLTTANKAALTQKRTDEKAKVDAIKAKVTSGELTQAQADEQIKALKAANEMDKELSPADETAQKTAQKALNDSFDAAVQTVVNGGSADQLTQVLPKLVENLKAENQKLNDRLAQLKTEVAAK